MSSFQRHNRFGFTLVELLVALMVVGIIFSAVATLAYAVGAAQKSSDQLGMIQTHVRYATLRISELIRYAKLVTLSGAGDDLAVWRADDNGNNQIDPSELVYIEAGAGRNHIYILEFPDAAGEPESLSGIKDGSAKASLVASYDQRRIEVLPQCSNVVFYPASIDEQSGFVGIGFDVAEAGGQRHYQITSSLLCRAEYLLDGSSIAAGDDD
jgi:prepilin-type N-terminal cleavage/methylation domain-containing protein